MKLEGGDKPLNGFTEGAILQILQQPIEAQTLDCNMEGVARHHSPRNVLALQKQEIV